MNNKEEYASYYIRQNLGIIIIALALRILTVIPYLGAALAIIGGVILFVFWLMSFVWSLQGEMKPIPVLGEQFQSWFKGF